MLRPTLGRYMATLGVPQLLSSIYTGRCDSETMVRAIAIKTARAVTAGMRYAGSRH